MDWEEARNRELAHWSAVRESVGGASQVELLTEINAADALCDKSRAEAGEAPDFCGRCLFYQQFGGCREVTGHMSDRAAARNWEGLRELLDGYIAYLRALRVPPPAARPAGLAQLPREMAVARPQVPAG